MKKIKEVLRLRLGLGASVRDIGASCSLSVSTVHEYLYRAEAAGLSWPSATELSDSELDALLFPPRPKGSEPERPMPDWNEVRRQVALKGVTLLLLWREYKRKHPNGYGYSRFADLFSNWEKTSGLRMLQRHTPGEKLFVDWSGLKLQITDPGTGEIHGRPVFVAAMGLSQFLFAKAYESEELQWWLQAHVDAFESLGALPKVVVPDNLRTGVARPCRFEPTLNGSYAELANYYGLAVIPARVRKPRDKAKVENGVQQVERWVLAPVRERTFLSLAEANDALATLLGELNERKMKAAGFSRRELFEQEDLPAMRELPARWRYATWHRRKIGPDYHVEIDRKLYSVPFTLVGKHVDVRCSASTIEVLFDGKRVASHLRAFGKRVFVTNPDHMPQGHKAKAEWTTERLRRWAEAVGPQTGAFVEALLASKMHPEQGFRACMGVVKLESRFGKGRLEAACNRALCAGALSYRSVKSILDKGLATPAEQPSLPALPGHHNVRGADYYALEEPCAN